MYMTNCLQKSLTPGEKHGVMYARRLQGKVAVVTASTEGIGLAISRRLGQEGAQVVISSRKQANVDKAVQQLKKENIQVIGFVCHVAKPEHRRRLLEQTEKIFGGIDILVSNAAANPYFGPTLKTPESVWDKVFETNVKATFFLIKDAVPYMEKCGGGSVVIVSSIEGYNPGMMLGAYGISKTALFGMVKALVPELAQLKIRVNGLAPGLVKTRFASALLDDEERSSTALQRSPIAQAMGRHANPDDMTGVTAMMCSDDALYLTGENIVVSGGVPSHL